MSLRMQLALVTGLSVAAAVVIGSAIVYFATRSTLRDAVDDSLVSRAEAVAGATDLPRHDPRGFESKEPSLESICRNRLLLPGSR